MTPEERAVFLEKDEVGKYWHDDVAKHTYTSEELHEGLGFVLPTCQKKWMKGDTATSIIFEIKMGEVHYAPLCKKILHFKNIVNLIIKFNTRNTFFFFCTSCFRVYVSRMNRVHKKDRLRFVLSFRLSVL